MNISTVSSSVVPVVPIPGKPSFESTKPWDESMPLEKTPANLSEDGKKKEKETNATISPEDLVMKPSPLPLEERLNQVISAEEVKDLLSMMTRAPLEEIAASHKLDTKR